MAALTNRANLPDAIVRAVANDSYSSGLPQGTEPGRYFTTTTLTAPTRQVHLKRRHADEITEDVSDRIWSLLGQAVHTILERAASTRYEKIVRIGREIGAMEMETLRGGDAAAVALGSARLNLRAAAGHFKPEADAHHVLVEKRLYMKLMMKKGTAAVSVTIGGAFDHLDLRDGILSDYKVTSVYSAKEGAKDEWIAQNSVNALLCEENGYPVQKTQNVVVFRDWSVNDAAKDPSYPQAQVMTIETPKWSREATLAWIESRLAALLESEDAPDDELPECSEDERWARGSAWVVVKAGNTRATPKSKRATKEEAEDFARQLEAEALAKKKPARYLPEFRPAESKRCAMYCSAMPFCNQGKRILAEAAAHNAEEAA